MPTDDRVEDIFFAIIPDLPTPDKIIFPFLQFIMASTALLKFLSIEDFNFCKDCISVTITSCAIYLNLLFNISETKYHLENIPSLILLEYLSISNNLGKDLIYFL